MEMLKIRKEEKQDYKEVENLIREAFWNVYVPGCSEHYVAHELRAHEDFVPELDLVAELDGRIVANVMYTIARLTDEAGEEKKVLTFGPLSVLPEYQRKGIGKQLLEASFEIAEKMGYDVIVIMGDPNNYVARGFKSCKRFSVCLEGGIFPTGMMVKELKPGVLDGRTWYYRESPAFEIDMDKFEEFDRMFELKEKKVQPIQEAFYIISNSTLN